MNGLYVHLPANVWGWDQKIEIGGRVGKWAREMIRFKQKLTEK